MEKKIVINMGVDVGNSDTKTPITTTPSGYSESLSKPFGVKDVLLYQGKFYAPSERRFPYVKDKTTSERAFILTLFGIAKEIIVLCEKNGIKKEDYQQYIADIQVVNLCVGLPPAHMHMLRSKTIDYYREKFSDGIQFQYMDYEFNLKLGLLLVAPQDYAALLCVIGVKGDKSIPNTFKEYYAVDIGGATVDVVPIRSNRPIVEECISLEVGTILMYDKIQNIIEENYGVEVSQSNIEDVLRDEPTIIADEIITCIKQSAADWFNNIIEILNQRGVHFQTNPIVFVGGGAKLFKEAIASNKIIKKSEFFGDVNSNALGYKKYVTKKAAITEKAS